ncbi:hypothetical protein [Pinibacter soli]|uniref:Uncharacterized protein n=1 Tax=Pinibacter soli TaxID=3044211 RepID=A0ABT6REA2_9BACT|nr:hypothetical protein [Pinibacter soli]MDI3320906.1 hypothetical protein [Pinibacter soli]
MRKSILGGVMFEFAFGLRRCNVATTKAQEVKTVKKTGYSIHITAQQSSINTIE